ncbi:hypothetical protein LTR37_009566 [Vermiconidia calcicola]|uniref:Uncharacterized protein n=1 Tax=Vermiconidia calcicola TaxID=1690605 RepID=A0ACC3NAD4_9PEZI|nr:hypothetical protein LTR37_009566 [Vermiconidia calcicola]
MSIRILTSYFTLSLLFSRLSAQVGYDYEGGVSLRYPNESCPRGTFYEGTSYQANCCPEGQFPAPKGSAYCCPSDGAWIVQVATVHPVAYEVDLADCEDHVLTFVKCADPRPPGYVVRSPQEALPTAWGAYQGPGQASTITTRVIVNPTSVTTPTVPSTSSSQSTSAASGSSGLSTGAQAGIGVGAGIVGIAAMALAVWFARSWRRHRSDKKQEMREHRAHSPVQLPSDNALHELNGVAPAKELSEGERYEMQSGWEGHAVATGPYTAR